MCSSEDPDAVQSSGESQSPAGAAWLLFRIYKGLISPVLHAFAPSRCLYLPTCSEYALVALTRFGAIRGGWMALSRVLRCNPLSGGGLDPVPEVGAHPDRLP